MKLDGFGIFVHDMDKMVAFYKDVLGFDIKYKKGEKNVYLIKDGVLFMMYGRNDFQRMTHRGYLYPAAENGTFEISLSVPAFGDVDREFDAVTAKGAKPILRPENEPWGQRTCYVADPEGNLIEISSFNSK